VLTKVRDRAERQYYDEGAILEEMAQLERQYEKGGMTEAEFNEREEGLWERLIAAREYWASQSSESEAS
jgi:hypothetical protein